MPCARTVAMHLPAADVCETEDSQMKRSKYLLLGLACGGLLLQASCITDLILFVAPLVV